MRVGGDEVVGARVHIGEIAAAAAGDGDLLADLFGVFEYDYAAPAFAGLDRAEQTRCAAADNNHVCPMHAQSLSCSWEGTEKGCDPFQVRCLCFLLTAFCLRFSCCSVGLGRGVDLSRLDNEFFVIIDAIAIYVDTHFDLVCLAVVYVAGVERKAILAAQE